MKKIFIISSVLLVVMLLFLGIYQGVFKNNAPEKEVPAADSKPEVPEKRVEKKIDKLAIISDKAIINPVLDKKTGTILYYSRENGTAWKMDFEGNGKQQISSKEFEGIKNVYWSPDYSKTLITIEKEKKLSFVGYDLKSQKETPLREGMDTAVWDNLGTKIFYKYFDAETEKRSINIANPDGSGWKKLADTEFRNVSIASVPLTANVSYWNSPKASEETNFLIVGSSGGETKTIMKGVFGADYLWSPDGKQAIVSSLADKESKMTKLGLVDIEGKYRELGIPTFASKCVWSKDNQTIYFALPGDIPDSAIIPDDYQDMKFFTDDTFWKIDTATGRQERIIEASEISGKHDSNSLFLSPSEDILYFINRVDGKLYKLIME